MNLKYYFKAKDLKKINGGTNFCLRNSEAHSVTTLYLHKKLCRKKIKSKVKSSGVFGYTSHGGEGGARGTPLVSNRTGSCRECCRDSEKALPIHPTKATRISNETTAKLSQPTEGRWLTDKGNPRQNPGHEIQADPKTFHMKLQCQDWTKICQ